VAYALEASDDMVPLRLKLCNYSPPNNRAFRALVSGYCGQKGLKRGLSG